MSDTNDRTIEGITKRLKEPFPSADIEWRVQQSGETNSKPWAMVLAYVTARAIQERLDDACGIFGWRNVYERGPDGGVLCGISIADADGVFITKWDGAENTNIEAVKGGLSSAFKRSGAVWGIGRYLYNLEATFAVIASQGRYSSKIGKKGSEKWQKWNPPALPEWAMPEGDKGETSAPQPPQPEPPITLEELLAKIAEAKAMPHLANIWDKYEDDMKLMSPPVQEQLAAAKNAKKMEIAKAAADNPDAGEAARKADLERGDGQGSILPEDNPHNEE